MTTLNTIIEEEVKPIARKILADNGGIDEVDDPKLFRDICNALTSAIQRAYKAGEREADAKWEREVEDLKQTVQCLEPFGIGIPQDPLVSKSAVISALDTILSKIRS